MRPRFFSAVRPSVHRLGTDTPGPCRPVSRSVGMKASFTESLLSAPWFWLPLVERNVHLLGANPVRLR